MENCIDKIYLILTKRKYCRSEALLGDRLKHIVELNVTKNLPIKLVGFWGVGQKKNANWADESSCQFLNDLNNEIKEVYPPGIEFTFIFATKHGVHNGYNSKDINSYIDDIIKLFNKYSFKYLFLDSLWDKYQISFNKIDNIYKSKPENWWERIENTQTIERNASNRNIRLEPKIAAQKYYIMRGLEKEMLEKEFNGYIFHAFSDSLLKNVLPNMPTLYFYAREGWSDTPWFVNK